MRFDLNDEFTKVLSQLGELEGRNACDIIRRAVALYKFLGDNIREGDGSRKVAITEEEIVEDENGNHVKKAIVLKEIRWI